jgi:hypothetical protein
MATALLSNKFQSQISKNGGERSEIDQFVFGPKMGLILKLFGCCYFTPTVKEKRI